MSHMSFFMLLIIINMKSNMLNGYKACFGQRKTLYSIMSCKIQDPSCISLFQQFLLSAETAKELV